LQLYTNNRDRVITVMAIQKSKSVEGTRMQWPVVLAHAALFQIVLTLFGQRINVCVTNPGTTTIPHNRFNKQLNSHTHSMKYCLLLHTVANSFETCICLSICYYKSVIKNLSRKRYKEDLQLGVRHYNILVLGSILAVASFAHDSKLL
jgi:hypothetical protein